MKKLGRIGFEPMKAEPTDLQSVPFNHSGTDPNKRNYKEENEKKQDNFFFFL
jgi:hypothetical protein